MLSGDQINHGDLARFLNINQVPGIVFFSIFYILLQQLAFGFLDQFRILSLPAEIFGKGNSFPLLSLIIEDQRILPGINDADLLTDQGVHQLINHDDKADGREFFAELLQQMIIAASLNDGIPGG